MADIIERYADRIKGVIGCYDRVVIYGTLPGICYAAAMTSLLKSLDIRIFDYTKWAEPLREVIRTNAEAIAASEGLKVEFVRKLRKFRKEERIKHHRKVEQKDGTTAFKLAPVRKTIYSLFPDLREILAASNRRYLDFLSGLDDPSSGIRALEKTTLPATDNGRTYRGLNFFSPADQQIFEVLGRGQVAVAGVRNADLRHNIDGLSTWSASTALKRLRTHGLIKKVARSYKYYLTDLGRRVVLTGLKLKELFVIAALAEATTG